MSGPYYILNEEKETVRVDVMQWAQWFHDKGKLRLIQVTELPDGLKVSTVFIGIDHSFGLSDSPKVFETMVFNGDDSIFCERCATYDQALAQHESAIDWANDKDCPCADCTPN